MKIEKRVDARMHRRLERFGADSNAKLHRIELAAGKLSRKLAKLERLRAEIRDADRDTTTLILEPLGFREEFGGSLKFDGTGGVSWDDGLEDPALAIAKKKAEDERQKAIADKAVAETAEALAEKAHKHAAGKKAPPHVDPGAERLKVLEGAGAAKNGS